ncbi:MAG: carbon-nitrogen hydrolase family protein [Rugosibacter sp.]|nr:MAG: carbon-nitrogen hydrolase family protein [Rugosibacter sp.]
MKLAALQMISGPAVGPNLDTAARLINEAATAGAQLIVLPEYFPLIGASDAERLAAREMIGHGPIQDFLSTMARQQGLWLVGGSLPLVSNNPDKMRNTCLVFNPQGERVARYDKIHLFGFHKEDEHYDEAATIEAGDEVVTCNTPCGRMGLSICYDLRFAELYRRMGEVNLIVVPAAFTETTGRAHWEILLRARAIENQCYVVAAAQGGRHPNGRMTHGNSMIIDPWGEILARIDKGEGVVTADFDPRRLASIRTRLPALQHRTLQGKS